MSENTDEKLKPCPFCGGKAHLLTSNGSFLVECSVCLTDFLNGPVGIGWYRSEKDAAADWNDRPSERALITQLEAAQKEIHDLKMKLSDAGCLLVEWKHRVEKAEAALSAANEKLKGDQVPVGTVGDEMRGYANRCFVV
ncbi:Lar family restriction alleviation protein, partial [Yersinia enterocolitica]|uniref:Lar family restriction alleviation protein n=1 Tax=Yersinia enterocolitica TaxID=630 RepID=UPI003D033F4F